VDSMWRLHAADLDRCRRLLAETRGFQGIPAPERTACGEGVDQRDERSVLLVKLAGKTEHFRKELKERTLAKMPEIGSNKGLFDSAVDGFHPIVGQLCLFLMCGTHRGPAALQKNVARALAAWRLHQHERFVTGALERRFEHELADEGGPVAQRFAQQGAHLDWA
jgi:hypothetical protein